MRFSGTVVGFVALVGLLSACGSGLQQNSEVAAQIPAAKPAAGLPKLQGKALVQIDTTKGPIVVELDGDNAPISSGNFVDLVKRGFYNGLTFHRVEPGFVIQGGDPLGNGTGGFIDPATRQERNIPLEIRTTKAGKPDQILYSKTFQDANLSPLTQPPVLTHRRGVIAMARSAYADSASSQFYITLADTNALDGSYAVFGKVIKGMETVNKIQVGDKMTGLKVTSGGTSVVPPAAGKQASSTP